MAQWWEHSPPTNVARFDSRCWHHMWVEFVVGSRPCSERFSPGYPVFLPPKKPTFPNSNSTWKQWMTEPLCGSHWNSNLFYLFQRVFQKVNSKAVEKGCSISLLCVKGVPFSMEGLHKKGKGLRLGVESLRKHQHTVGRVLLLISFQFFKPLCSRFRT